MRRVFGFILVALGVTVLVLDARQRRAAERWPFI